MEKKYDFKKCSPEFQFTCYRALSYMLARLGKHTQVYPLCKKLQADFDPAFAFAVSNIWITKSEASLLRRWMLVAFSPDFPAKEIHQTFDKELAQIDAVEVFKELGD